MDTKDYFLIALTGFIIFLFVRIDYKVTWKDKFIYVGSFGLDEEPIVFNTIPSSSHFGGVHSPLLSVSS